MIHRFPHLIMHFYTEKYWHYTQHFTIKNRTKLFHYMHFAFHHSPSSIHVLPNTCNIIPIINNINNMNKITKTMFTIMTLDYGYGIISYMLYSFESRISEYLGVILSAKTMKCTRYAMCLF